MRSKKVRNTRKLAQEFSRVWRNPWGPNEQRCGLRDEAMRVAVGSSPEKMGEEIQGERHKGKMDFEGNPQGPRYRVILETSFDRNVKRTEIKDPDGLSIELRQW